MFYLESFKMIANGGSKFLSFSLQLQGLHYSFKKIGLCRMFVVLPKERSNSVSKNWITMRLRQRRSYLHKVWHGNLILKTLSCENPSNIWELNYRAQMWGANKLTGKVVLILQWEEWISLFGRGTFQRYIFMFSTRFVRTWRTIRSNLKKWFVSQNMEPLSLRSTSWGVYNLCICN